MDGTGSARIRAIRFLAVVPLVVLLGAGCDQSDEIRESALSSSRPVEFMSADGVRLEGRLFGEGSVGVVLSHMRPADQSSWFDFAATLADGGYLVLTYNFRGYCPGNNRGCSEGEQDISAIWQDVVGAVRFVRSEGAADVALVGASMGGTASLVAAAREAPGPVAVVTLSAPTSIEGLVADASVVQQSTAAKLFIAGELDSPYGESAEQLYEESPPPKRVEILPTTDHGTDLLTGNQGSTVRQLLLTYLAHFAPAA